MEQQDRGASPARPSTAEGPSRHRRPSVTVLTVVIACAVIAGGATGLTAIVARTSRRPIVRTLAASCVAPQASPAGVAPNHLGAWPFDLLAAGTFGSAVSGPSGLYALQACGTQETQLRVLHLTTGGKVLGASAAFDRAALLTSSVALSGGSLYVGASRLDISGPSDSGPYALTLYRLDPVTLRVVGSRTLGRGYGLSLWAAGGQGGSKPSAPVLLASTGSTLLSVVPGSLSTTTLASFGSSIAQHIALASGVPYVAVSLFAPAAVPPAATANIVLLDVASGRVVSAARLSSGSDVESLVLGSSGLWASISDGTSTQVRRYPLPTLATSAPTGVPAMLQAIDLSGADGVIWAWGPGLLACSDASTGRLLASATPSGSSTAPVSGAVESGSTTFVVTEAGVGSVATPAACRVLGHS